MRKIRILHTEWSDGWGGQEMRILAEMKGFMAQNFKIAQDDNACLIECELACKNGAKIANYALNAGFVVHYLPFKSKFDLKSIFSLAKLLKERKIDILNTHSGIDTWCGILASKLANVRSIRTRHLSAPINPSRLNFINELADFVLTTGKGVKDAMIANNRINPNKIASIPTGIDESVFAPNLYDKNECKSAFNLPKNAVIIGSLGVLRSVKNQQMLLNAILEIHKIHKNIYFILAGDGPKKDDLERFINENKMNAYTKLIGHINEPAKFLCALDIFVLSSKNEGVPQALAQALFMQKACLSTDVGSIKDLYDGSNFILYENSLNALISALDGLLSKPDSIKNLSQNPQNFVRQNFSLEQMCAKLKNIYLKLSKN